MVEGQIKDAFEGAERILESSVVKTGCAVFFTTYKSWNTSDLTHSILTCFFTEML